MRTKERSGARTGKAKEYAENTGKDGQNEARSLCPSSLAVNMVVAIYGAVRGLIELYTEVFDLYKKKPRSD